MGACASKPKESNYDSLPGDNPASYDQMPEGVRVDPTIEVSPVAFTLPEQSGAEVVTENKEKPLMDTLEPKQEGLNSDGESKVEQDTAITGPVPEISGSNPEMGDPEKVLEAGVESEDQRQEHDTSDAVLVVETQKPDAGGGEVVPNSENLKKQDVEKPPLSE